MLFGEFLQQTGLAKAETVAKALRVQAQERMPMGELAVRSDVLTDREVSIVLSVQARTPGRLFGEIAVDYGFLTQPEVDGLEVRQRLTRRPLGEVLVAMGVLGDEQLQRALERYRRQTGRDGARLHSDSSVRLVSPARRPGRKQN